MELTDFQKKIIDKAISNYIDCEELLKQAQKQNDNLSIDYLQSKMSSIITRLIMHFSLSRYKLVSLIIESRNK